jgi:molybdopterin converting factor small subunit
MLVKARFAGMVRHYTKDTEKCYELPDGACVSDLLMLIGREYGERMPGQMWSPEEERFHPLIRAIRRGSPMADDDEELADGDEIFIISRMAGG